MQCNTTESLLDRRPFCDGGEPVVVFVFNACCRLSLHLVLRCVLAAALCCDRSREQVVAHTAIKLTASAATAAPGYRRPRRRTWLATPSAACRSHRPCNGRRTRRRRRKGYLANGQMDAFVRWWHCCRLGVSGIVSAPCSPQVKLGVVLRERGRHHRIMSPRESVGGSLSTEQKSAKQS